MSSDELKIHLTSSTRNDKINVPIIHRFYESYVKLLLKSTYIYVVCYKLYTNSRNVIGTMLNDSVEFIPNLTL